MSRDFLSNFEPIPTPDPVTVEDESTVESSEKAEWEDHQYVRTLTFVWQDQTSQFFDYSSLGNGSINETQTSMQLIFGPITIELVGIRMLTLFADIKAHKTKYIYCDDAHFNLLTEDVPIVNDIVVRAT